MKQEILDELEELLNIPQMERIIHHKVEELKLYLKDEIDHYRELKEGLRRSVYGEMTVLETDMETSGQEPVFLFQLNKEGDEHWGPPRLEPPPPRGYDAGDILPDPVVEHIVSDKFPLREFQTIPGLSLPEIADNRFDLDFIKYSEHHILGTVCRREVPSDAAVEEISHYDPREAEENNYNELLYYMQKFPPLRIYFLTEFHMKVKPLINGDMVKLTASLRPGDRW